MTPSDAIVLLPFIVLGASVVVIMLVIAFFRNHALTAFLTVCSLALCMLSLLPASELSPLRTNLYIIIDGYAVFYIGLISASSAAVALLSYGYFEGRTGIKEEYYLVLLTATLGSAILVSSNHFASFFLGLELLSISLYALIAYVRPSDNGVEAGLKYLILAAISASFLLFGMALIHADFGTMEFADVAAKANAARGMHLFLFLAGFSMMTVGIGFKLAIVPFQLWIPDVYQGAPAPVTGFIATVSKGAVFALLLRLFSFLDPSRVGPIFIAFSVLALASMFVGNFLALRQDNVKRLLAYSSVAHIGYMLVALLAGGDIAPMAVTVYLATYFVTTLGAFGIITVLSGKEIDCDRLEDYRGLIFEHPWLAGVFAFTMLSLAGIPVTAGFVGKFYVFLAGIKSSLWVLVLALVINTVIGLFYYIRVVFTMFSLPEETATAEMPAERFPAPIPSHSLAAGIVLTVLTLLLIGMGVYPSPVLSLIHSALSGF